MTMLPLFRNMFAGVMALGLTLGSISAQAPAPVHPPIAGAAAKAESRWAKEIAAFANADRETPPPASPIVFTGSSSIRRWTDLTQDFPNHRVLNRGFGGSQFSDIRLFFDELILRYQPRQVVMYSGGNDINAKKPVEEVFADMKAIVERIHRELPKTRVAVIAVALNPRRWEQRDQVVALNRMMRDYLSRDSRDAFVDVVPAMLRTDGTPKPDIFVSDQLHMNRKGYDLWIPLVRRVLSEP
ncbi:MAG: hypothetical protein KBA71_04540 [Opitutaceae bacterium]|nr:hypothetical protein [Opitutaceae bacterium]